MLTFRIKTGDGGSWVSNEERPVLNWNSSCGDPLEEEGGLVPVLGELVSHHDCLSKQLSLPFRLLHLQPRRLTSCLGQNTYMQSGPRREGRTVVTSPPSLLVPVNSASPVTPDSKETEHKTAQEIRVQTQHPGPTMHSELWL